MIYCDIETREVKEVKSDNEQFKYIFEQAQVLHKPLKARLEMAQVIDGLIRSFTIILAPLEKLINISKLVLSDIISYLYVIFKHSYTPVFPYCKYSTNYNPREPPTKRTTKINFP